MIDKLNFNLQDVQNKYANVDKEKIQYNLNSILKTPGGIASLNQTKNNSVFT